MSKLKKAANNLKEFYNIVMTEHKGNDLVKRNMDTILMIARNIPEVKEVVDPLINKAIKSKSPKNQTRSGRKALPVDNSFFNKGTETSNTGCVNCTAKELLEYSRKQEQERKQRDVNKATKEPSKHPIALEIVDNEKQLREYFGYDGNDDFAYRQKIEGILKTMFLGAGEINGKPVDQLIDLEVMKNGSIVEMEEEFLGFLESIRDNE